MTPTAEPRAGTHLRRWSGRLGAVVLALAAALSWLALAEPASGHPNCFGYADEADLVNDSDCRNTFIFDPGRGDLMSRQDLLAARGLYARFGFTDNFLWYSHQTTEDFPVGDPREFSGCFDGDNPTGNGTLCPGRIRTDPPFTIAQFFSGGPVGLHTFEFGGTYIVRACGNFGKPPRANPVPTISGVKFHDLDRDGARDVGEGGLSGWTIVLTRESTRVGQPLGEVARMATGSGGGYSFALNGLGPGRYVVTEVQRSGFTRTTSARRVVDVGFGVGDRPYTGNNFGNVENETDLAKTAFALLDPPAELRADQTTELTVRARIANEGPAGPIVVEDALLASSPNPDCTITPARQAVRRTLGRGEAATIDFTVRVLCTEPSFHDLRFEDVLSVVTPGVAETDPADDTAAFTATIPVIDEADVGATGLAVDCPARGDVDVAFECLLTGTLENRGDHGPAIADVALSLSGPADCVIAPSVPGGDLHGDVRIPVGSAPLVQSTFRVTCGNRSDHAFSGSADVSLDHLHVEDPSLANNAAAGAADVEVFEDVDLVALPLRIDCAESTEGVPTTGPFGCEVLVSVRNDGPATMVRTLTETVLSGAPDCQIAPGPTRQERLVLDAGESASFTEAWEVTCASANLHTFLATATIGADEPHAEEVDLSDNTARVRWVPTDIKPGSDPSSVNVRRRSGLVPLVILSTPDFEAPAAIEVASLRFGQTGFEDSIERCAPEGEDRNGDGLADLVCKARVADTALTCDSREGVLSGRLIDGTPIEGRHRLNVVGCRR